MKLFVIALIGFGTLSEHAAGYLTGREAHEEFAEPSLPVVNGFEPTVECIPPQDREDPPESSQNQYYYEVNDLFSNEEEEEPLRLAALPAILTAIGATALLSGCEVNPSGCGAGFMRKPCPGPSRQEMDRVFREADKKFPGPDSQERCLWELRQLGLSTKGRCEF